MDPESKGIVEHLVGYAKRDLPRPAADAGLAVWNDVAATSRRGSSTEMN